MARKPNFSPTKISTYLECPTKYRYVYIDKIGRFFLKSKSFYSFGSTLHHVLQVFHAEGATASIDEMLAVYRSGWIGAGYESPEQEAEYAALGEEILRSYHSSAMLRKSLGIETLFTEKQFSADLGEFVVSGRFDRLDIHPDGALEIVDYKSGRMDTSADEMSDDLAMRIYQVILRRNYPDARVIATIHALRTGHEASDEMPSERAAEFEAYLADIAAEILNRDFDEAVPKRIQICETCDFRSRCEQYWRKHKQEDEP